MHLFECFQAWARVSETAVWPRLAKGQARLCTDYLIDIPGLLAETFDADWSEPEKAIYYSTVRAHLETMLAEAPPPAPHASRGSP